MTALPEWTEPSEKRGLDPLGMQNSGVALYQSLLPGISNVTLRMRYYGYYCWLSDAYARHEGSTNLEDWRRWVRRGEALYALISSAAGGEGGVGGIDWANERLSIREAEIDFAEAASVDPLKVRYLRQSMGVFGGAYYSQLAVMDLFREGDHGIPKVSNGVGLDAANAFRKAIGTATEALLIEKIQTARVTPDELKKLQAVAPSNILPASDERDCYERALFRATEETPDSDHNRRATLLLILRAAEALGKRPDPDAIRWYLFQGAGGGLPETFERQRLRWETYQAHDLFQLAAAALLSWAIALIGEIEEGLEPGEIASEVRLRIERAHGVVAGLSWKAFCDGLNALDANFQDWSRTILDKRYKAEDKILDALRLMAALFQRCEARADLASEIGRSFLLGGDARSIRSELAWLRSQELRPVGELIAEYIAQRVVLRHGWVAMQKFRRQKDYTFLFEARDGRLAKRADYLPVLTTPRLAPAIQFLADISLVSRDGLTARGRALLGTNK